jgi:flagellar biosynthesis/type III secretory pathway chaperone
MNQTEAKIAVLTRLREMLRRQRGKFQDYLSLLEKEEGAIRSGDAERLISQVEMEKAIIAEIFELKKVIQPLETLYRAAYPETEDSVPRLKATLEKMGEEVVRHNEANRILLRQTMEELRREIGSLRAWPRAGSPFAEVVPSLVDITT